MYQQLALPFSFNSKLGFEQFVSGANSQAVKYLKDAASGSGEPFIFIWGEQGTGKTHLLNAVCETASACGRRAAYIPFETFFSLSPTILEGLETHDLICLDDINLVSGNRTWEVAIFTLYNQLRDSNRSLIVSANSPPSCLALQLPDLVSRLSWGLTLYLNPLGDEEKLSVLTSYAQMLGFILSPDVGQYLMVHCNRDLSYLQSIIRKLDEASISAQKKMSLGFVKTYLSALGAFQDQ